MSVQLPKINPSLVSKPMVGSLSVFVNDIDGELWYKDSAGAIGKFADYGSPTVQLFEEITFADLQSKILLSELETNKAYLITDFQTIYDQPDFDISGSPKGLVETKIAPIEPILVTASSSNTLMSEAWQPAYPLDKLRYDVTFIFTEVMGVSAKGRISERIDHLNNRTDYDHRNVVFKRYESNSGSGVYDSYVDTGFASTEKKTFSIDTDAYSNNNHVGNYFEYFSLDGNTFVLSNNVFGEYCENNTFGSRAYNNTFGESFANNISAGRMYNNKISSGCVGNTFDIEFNSNAVGENFVLNKISPFSTNNIIGNDFRENSVGSIFSYNLVGSSMWNNSIDDGFQFNEIGNNFQTNKIGCFFTLNQISDNFQTNIASDNFQSNIITGSFLENTIEQNFQSNTIYSGLFFKNEFSRDCSNNLFQVGSAPIRNVIKSNFSSNEISNSFQSNTIFGNFEGNYIESQFNKNTIRNTFGLNDVLGLSNTFVENDIGNNFYLNTVNKFDKNAIGNYFQNNTINNDFVSNKIGNEFEGNIINGSFGDNLGLSDGNVIGDRFRNNSILGTFLGNIIHNNFSLNSTTNDFKNNTIRNEFTSNTLDSPFEKNVCNGAFSGCNMTQQTFIENIFKTFTSNLFNNAVAQVFRYNTFKADAGGLDFYSATHVFNAYSCEIDRRLNLNLVLHFVANTSDLLFDDPIN